MEAAEAYLRAAATDALSGGSLDASGCHALASALNALYQAYAARAGSLPMRRLDTQAQRPTSAAGVQADVQALPMSLLELFAVSLDRFVDVIDAGVVLEAAGGAAGSTGRGAAGVASSGAIRGAPGGGGAASAGMFHSLGPRQAGILVASAKLRFAIHAAVGAADTDAIEADWTCGVVERLRRAACVLLHGAGATLTGPSNRTNSASGSTRPPADLSPVWVARTCQQLAAKLFNASQPRRAACLVDCCVELLALVSPPDADAAREAAAVRCCAHQIGAHCMLQLSPPDLSIARRHATAAIDARCVADRLTPPPPGAEGGLRAKPSLDAVAGRAPAAPSLRELCALALNCEVRAVSAAGGDDGEPLPKGSRGPGAPSAGVGLAAAPDDEAVPSGLAPAERRKVLSCQLDEAAALLARTRSAPVLAWLGVHARQIARLLLEETPGSAPPAERAAVMLQAAEVERAFAPAAAPTAEDGPSGARAASLAQARDLASLALSLLPACAGDAPCGGRAMRPPPDSSLPQHTPTVVAPAAAFTPAEPRDTVNAMRVKDLREELQRRGLPVDGRKAQLVDRLEAVLAEEEGGLEEPEEVLGGEPAHVATSRGAPSGETAAPAGVLGGGERGLAGTAVQCDAAGRVGTEAAAGLSDAVLELRARLCLLIAEIEMEEPPTAAAQPEVAVVAAGAAPRVAHLVACAFADWAVLLGPSGGRAPALTSVSAAAGDLFRTSKLFWGMMAEEEALDAAAMAVRLAAGRGSALEQAARGWHASLLLQARAPAVDVEAALGQAPVAAALQAVGRAEAVLTGEGGGGAHQSLPGLDAELHVALRDCPPADALLRSQLRRTLARVALAAGAPAAGYRHAEMALRLAKQQHPANAHAHDSLACTRDALMVMAEAWRARGSYADALKYLAGACLLADRSGVWRLIVDSRLAVVSLHTDAMRFDEAGACEPAVRQALVGLREAQASLCQALAAAGQAGHSAPLAAGFHHTFGCTGDMPEARYELVRTDLMLARGLAPEAAVAAGAGLRLVAAQRGPHSPHCAAQDPAVGARGPCGGASGGRPAGEQMALLELAFWSRAAEAAVQARDWTRARECADRAVAQAAGARGLLSAAPPVLRGDAEAARALVVSAEARLPPFDAPAAGEADAARSELSHALELCEGGAPPALVRRACLALAALCIGLDTGYGAQVLAGASGVALRNQLVLVDEGRSKGSGAGEGDGGSGATSGRESGRTGGEDDSTASLSAALGSLSLAAEPPSPQAPQPEPHACRTGVGRWIEAPPDGATVCTIALAPGGQGLLLASWRSGREPLAMRTGGTAAHVSAEQRDELGSENSGGGGVEAMLVELNAILGEGRSTNAGGQPGPTGQPPAAQAGLAESSGQGESPSSPERMRLHPDSPTSAWPRVELIPDSAELSVVVLDRARPTAVLGRGQCGACFVDLEEVSSEHCSVSLDASGRLTLTDLSTNGTFIDGSRPPKRDGRTCELRDGSRVTLVGKTARECTERFGALAPSYVARIRSGGGELAKAQAEPRGASAVAASVASAARVTVAGVARSVDAAPPRPSVPADGRHAREQLDRSLYWSKREQLDLRLGALAARMQESLLGPVGAALLLAPPSDLATRAAAEGLGQALVDQATKLRWRCDAGLLRAMSEASPWLEDGKLRGALRSCARGPTGKPLAPSALVAAEALLRNQWRAAGLGLGPAAGSASNGKGASIHGTSRAAAGPGPGASGRVAGSGTRSSGAEIAAGEARSPLILVLDEVLSALPWESMPCLSDQPVCRLPCAALLGRCVEAAQQRGGAASADSAFYVLNPSGDLSRTQSTLEPRFARPPWEGVAGQPPAREALYAALEHKDLFVYCGHGDGSKYVSADRLQRLPRCAVAMLMGCSSGALRRLGGLAPSGMPLSYLHGRAPAVVANLWDVTDGEIDRYSQALVEMCERGVPLLLAVARARRACRLRFLTGAAAVCYGAPIDVRPRAAE